MSRTHHVPYRYCRRFPRVSGDEPMNMATMAPTKLFSPRERG